VRLKALSAVDALLKLMRLQSSSRISLAILLGLAIGVTALVLGAIGLAVSPPLDELDLLDSQLRFADGLEESISGSLRRIESTLELIASREALIINPGDDSLSDLRAMNASLAEIVIMADDGDIVAHSGDENVLGQTAVSFLDIEWLHDVMEGRTYRGEMDSSLPVDKSMLMVLPSASGGLVAGRVRIDALWNESLSIADLGSVRVYLLAVDGRVLAHGGEGATDADENDIWEPLASGRWQSGDHWVGTYENTVGIRFLSAAVTVSGLDWAVAVEKPMDDANALKGLALTVTVAGTAIVLASVGLGLARAFSGRTRMGDMVRARLDSMGIVEEDPLAIGNNDAKEQGTSISLNGEAVQRESVLRRAKEYELAMSHLRESEERYSLAIRGANDGLWDWDLRKKHIYFSSKWKSMLGYLDVEIGSNTDEWFDRVHEDDREQLKAKIRAHMDGIDSHLEKEHRLLHRDGYYIWVLTRGIAVRDETGLATRMAGVMTDITERKHNEEQWQFDALHDSLTGLANRALFQDRLGHALERAKRANLYRFAVLFLDLDQFKSVNDKLGHVVGDKLLIEVSRRLARCLREIDTIARLGGDEFVILLEEIEVLQDATAVAGRIHLSLKPVFELDGEHKIFTSTSIGVVMGASHYDDPEFILRDADTALYRAKELGRARSAIFDEEMRGTMLSRLRMEVDLRSALEQQEIDLIFDPVASCADLGIHGMHALVQWSSSGNKEKLHGEFSSISENPRLMLHVGSWAIEEACRQRVRWWPMKEPGNEVFVSIGLSAAQMKNPDLRRHLLRVIRDWPTVSSNLAFEIEAADIGEDLAGVKKLFTVLKSMGFQLHLTGCSRDLPAGALLKEHPFDLVKVGRLYVDRLVNKSEDDHDIVRKIVRDAHQLGRIVVAEGVDSKEDFAQVKALGCDLCQGLFVSQLLDSKGVIELLNEKIASKQGRVEE